MPPNKFSGRSMDWILVLLIFNLETGNGTAMTSISGFSSRKECVATGDAWKETKRELDRDYVCLLGKEK